MTEPTQYVRDWFARAQEDIVVMNLILEKGSGSPNLACFHAQQAAELSNSSNNFSLRTRNAKE